MYSHVDLTPNTDILGLLKTALLSNASTPLETSGHLSYPWEEHGTREVRNAKYITNSCI